MNDTTAEELAGKVALVTGASSGIGAATAKALAAEGASVALAARRTDRLNTLEDDIGNAGGEAFSVTADITESADVEKMVRATREAYGHLDILINNAGIMLPAPVERADLDDWRRMVSVNLLGTMNATRVALPALREGEGGHVVNLSSDARRSASAEFSAYAATKAGVRAFSDSLRKEVADDNVRVTVLEPGVTNTELPAHITDTAMKDDVEGLVESMTTLESEDVAEAIRYAVTRPPHIDIEELLVRPTDAG